MIDRIDVQARKKAREALPPESVAYVGRLEEIHDAAWELLLSSAGPERIGRTKNLYRYLASVDFLEELDD